MEAVHGAFALVLIDRLEDALALTEQMLADAAERGSVLGFLAGSTFRSLTYLRQGALVEAEADGLATLEMARELGLLFTIPFIAGDLALTLNERGRCRGRGGAARNDPTVSGARGHAGRDHVA